jgi:hypothetical protein
MSNPTIIAQLRTGLGVAIASVFADPGVLAAIGGVAPNMYESKSPDGWFLMNIVGAEGVVYSYSGKPLEARGPLGERKNRIRFAFSIALCSGNWADPVGATYTAADLAEYLMGSPTLPDSTPNLGTNPIGNIKGDDIYLRYDGEATKLAPNSTVQGGRIALVQNWSTFPVVAI